MVAAASAATVLMRPSESLTSDRYLATSPYPDHLLDLDTLDPQTRLLARALVVLDATRTDYATASYADSFSYGSVVEELRGLVKQLDLKAWTASSYFIVAFRSQIPPSTRTPAQTARLNRLDEAAHAEANASGGLLRYWFASPDADGRNLATCVWNSPADARRAGHGAEHRRAAGEVQALYREWRIERYRLVLGKDLLCWDVVAWEN